MRYMMIMNVTPAAAEAAKDMDMAEMFAVMGAYNEEMMKAGVLLAGEGLSEVSEGFRLDFSSTPPTQTDGPFAEAREIFNGFWIIEVANREEAEHWARKCPLGPGTTLEVRRVQELSDFDAEAGGEWFEKEKEWRAEQESRSAQS